MTHIPDAAFNEMLKQLPDEQRRSLAHIVNGKISHQVRCMGGCNGAVIAYLYVDGTDRRGNIKYRVEPTLVDGKMKLRAWRPRLDGQLGFECWCRNDSRIAPQEAGVISMKGVVPSRSDLETVFGNLLKTPANYPEVNGVREVNGFQIERIAV